MNAQIGILALQGAFREHKQALIRLGARVKEVRLPNDLFSLDGLIIPGGESTTIAKLIQNYGFDEALPEFYKNGGAIWGTCAGAILIATNIIDYPQQFRLNLLDITVERNAYGRQISSFEASVVIKAFNAPLKAIFIRAPRIVEVSDQIEVLASFNSDPIMVRKGRLMATVFHPELRGDDRVHAYFLEQVIEA